MPLDDFSTLTSILSAGHLFSEHVGMDEKRLRKVGPIQYAIHWLYGRFEPNILRLGDFLLSTKSITDTRIGKLFIQAFASAQPYLPYGIIVTTEAAENMLNFVANTEGPKGARFALGPCVCQYALNRWKEPCKKDLVVLYGADIYVHLDRGYELVTVEEAKSMLRECHKAGLVHGVEFCLQSGKWTFVICNCDTKICLPTRLYFHTGKFHYAGPEIAGHDPSKCVGKKKCGNCLERCIYTANQALNDTITFDASKCMGCGLCVSTCIGEARAMKVRDDYRHNHQVAAEILLGQA